MQEADFIPNTAHMGQLASYINLARTKIITYQWEALNDRVAGAEPSGAIRNFRIAAGLEQGRYHGFVFQDSDVGKWIEAAAWSLRHHPDPLLEQRIDETVAIMAKAQAEDGYLNTYFTIQEPGKRWTNLTECHELYSAGHLLEGAVAYARATGKKQFLEVMLRYVDLIDATFGPGPGQIQGSDGHEEIELALLKLHDYTKEPRHLALAEFFISVRGQTPSFFHQEWEARGRVSHWSKQLASAPELSYHQAHLPVLDQEKATGHAVRAAYLYTAMAELLRLRENTRLDQACSRLWKNITEEQIYVSGAIGSTRHGEAFGFDYHLPNDKAYGETCASIGLIFFAQAMMKAKLDASYADTIEQVLYNTVMAAVDLEGRKFTYVNPQEIWPEASAKDPDRQHVKPERQAWFGCACCPPNLARLLLSFDRYMALEHQGTLYLNHYCSGTVEAHGLDGGMGLKVETDYPRTGSVTLIMAQESNFALALRIPAWCRSWKISRNGHALQTVRGGDGYVHLQGPWQASEKVDLEFSMEIEFLEAHPLVRANAGKVCLRRGPVLYCIESCDNGTNLSRLSLDCGATPQLVPAPGLPEGYHAILVQGYERVVDQGWRNQLYRPRDASRKPCTILAVPYSLWGQRSPGEMLIWLPAS